MELTTGPASRSHAFPIRSLTDSTTSPAERVFLQCKPTLAAAEDEEDTSINLWRIAQEHQQQPRKQQHSNEQTDEAVDSQVPSSRSLFVVKSLESKTKLTKVSQKVSSEAAIALLTRTGGEAVCQMKNLIGTVNGRPFIWDRILKELECRGSRTKAWELFQFLRDKQGEYKLREQNYTCIIGILTRAGMLSLAREVFDEMTDKGMNTTAFPCTTMIQGYASHGHFEEASSLFEEMQRNETCKPTLVTYTIMIHASLSKRNTKKAMELFKQMKTDGGIEGDEVLYNCLVNGLINGGCLDDAQAAVQEMYENNMVPNLVTYTNLINQYGKGGKLQECSKIFNEMRARGRLPGIWTYNILIQWFGNEGLVEEAMELFEEMELEGCGRDAHSYNTMISVLGKKGFGEKAERLLKEMKAKAIPPNEVTYNTLLDMYTKKGYSGKAFEVLQRMAEDGFSPNIWTYNILLRSAGKESIEELTRLYEDIKRKDVKLNIVTYSAMINHYGRHGLYVEAQKVWDEMVAAGCTPSIITYSGLIESFSAHGMHKEARESFEEMRAAGIEPDTKIYTALMDAYGQAGLCDEARELFLEMQREGCNPDGITYGILVRAFAKGGRLPEGLEYLKVILDYEEPGSYICRKVTTDYKDFYDLYTRLAKNPENT